MYTNIVSVGALDNCDIPTSLHVEITPSPMNTIKHFITRAQSATLQSPSTSILSQIQGLVRLSFKHSDVWMSGFHGTFN